LLSYLHLIVSVFVFIVSASALTLFIYVIVLFVLPVLLFLFSIPGRSPRGSRRSRLREDWRKVGKKVGRRRVGDSKIDVNPKPLLAKAREEFLQSTRLPILRHTARTELVPRTLLSRQIVAIWTVKAGRRLNVVDWSCRLIKRVKKGLKLDTSPTSKAGEVVYVGLLLDWYGDIVVLPEVTLNFVFARSNTMCLWTVFAYKDLPKGIVAKYVLHPAVWRMLEGSLGRMLEDNPVATLEKA
jgi:hypothetical protein